MKFVFCNLRFMVCFLSLMSLSAPLHSQSAGPSAKKSPSAPTRRAASRSSGPFDQVSKRAAAAREADRVDEAIELYRQGLRLRPSWGEGWWYVGTLLYDGDRYGEGRDAFRRLVSIEPKRGPSWALLGLCEFRLRDYELALDHLQRGRALGLGDNKDLRRVTRYHVALLLTRSGQFEAAQQVLLALAREEEESPALIEAMGLSSLALPYLPSEIPAEKREAVYKAGRAYYYLGSRLMDQANREYEELVAQFPNVPNVHYSYGVFLMLRDTDAALEEFRKELQVSPFHVPARLQLAFEYLKRSDYAAGLPHAEEAVKLAPRSFAARNALGRILLEMGQIERAITELEEGVRLAPDSPETRYALARAYARAQRKEDASRERAEFVRLDKIRRGLADETAASAGDSETRPEGRPPI